LAEHKTIQVYEYGWLIINQKYGASEDIIFREVHYKSLAQYLTANPACPYYTLYLNKVRFSNYVGVITVKDLTIEILPKTDKHDADKGIWQQILLEMLIISLEVKAQTSTTASINLKKHNVLESYLHWFLKETETLMHHGLVKKYHQHVSNQTVLKGKLLIPQHLSKNIIHKEYFFVSHSIYDRDHVYNAILHETLRCIIRLNISDSIIRYGNKLLLNFPECKRIKISQKIFSQLSYDRKTEPYKKALELAKLILLNYHPDVKGGNNHILAIMFDMNLLWESFIYKMLIKAKHSEDLKYAITRQKRKPFWKHPDGWTLHLIPDLLIKNSNGVAVILDTKWKYRNTTSIEDVRQMYAYGNYFGATKRYLIYPDNILEGVHRKEGTFYELQSQKLSDEEKCGLLFVNLLKSDNTLNVGIGSKILREIFT
jgi:5-methylcytosine-specific restriction enzyme subunit McrC